MEFRFCPACGKAALHDEAELGGKRCKLCKKAFFIQDLNAVPALKKGERMVSHVTTKKKEDVPLSNPTAFKIPDPHKPSDKGVSP